MNAFRTSVPRQLPPACHPPPEPFGFVDSLSIIARWRRFIIVTVLLVTASAVAVSFLLPKKYQATATLLPPKNSAYVNVQGLGMSRVLRQLTPFSMMEGQIPPTLYPYVAVLKSRAFLRRAVTALDLQRVYGAATLDDAVTALDANMDYMVDEEGTLRIEVVDKEPQRCLDMAWWFVGALDSVNRSISAREAAAVRAFLEQRLSSNAEELLAAEEALKTFQERNGAVRLNAGEAKNVSTSARLAIEKVLAEYEVGYLERTLGSGHPSLGIARIRLDEMERQLHDVPRRDLEYVRLFREFTMQQRLHEILLPLLVQARIDEQRTMPTVLVIDEPRYPEHPSSPKKTMIVLVFFLLAVVISVVLPLVVERMRLLAAWKPEQFREIRGLFRLRRSVGNAGSAE